MSWTSVASGFLHTYAKRIEVLDAKGLGLSSVIDPAVVDYFNHSLLANVYPSTITPSLRGQSASADHPPL